MARRKTQTVAGLKKSQEALERDLEKFLKRGKKIKRVPAGATGQDEKNRSKHIVISRKQQIPYPSPKNS